MARKFGKQQVDYGALQTTLLNSKIQQENNALYQTINNLIKVNQDNQDIIAKLITDVETLKDNQFQLRLNFSYYTPVLTDLVNIVSSVPFVCYYVRVHNTVLVSGRVDVDPNTPNNDTQLGISLPIASNFISEQQCAGVTCGSTVDGRQGGIFADVTNKTVIMQWDSQNSGLEPMYFIFMYQVL